MTWYKDAAVWRWIGWRYLPWIAALNLAWEIAHLPLYIAWIEASAGFKALALLGCTLADVLLGFAALVLALFLTRAHGIAAWNWAAVAAAAVLIGAIFTVFGEWLNTEVWANWAYSKRMPTLPLGTFQLGVSPLAQWLLLPPLALWLARRGYNGNRP
jgi:hypothetical protein